MKRAICVVLSFLSGLFLTTDAWTAQPYEVSIRDILDVKAALDDPTPFYTECEYFRKFIPPKIWDQITVDQEASRAAWEKAVGFRARDVVGQIASEIKPGKYTLADKEKFPFKELMTPYHYQRFNQPGRDGLPKHIGYFTDFEVIETQQIWHAEAVANATIEHMGKTQLDEDGYILYKTHVAGYAFPRPSGKHKAMQVLYNLHTGGAGPESGMNYDITIGVNSRGKIDHQGTASYLWLLTQGRVMYPPLGWFDKRAEKEGEALITLYTVLSPRDLYGNVYFELVYQNPLKDPNILVYVNFLRRIRQVSATDTQDQAVGQDLAFDDTGFLSQSLRPDRYPYEVSVIDEREFLMPAYTFDGASYLDSRDGWKWKGLRFERRPMWVVEMKQLDRNYIYSKRVLYFDKETLVPQLEEMYDQKGRYYRHLDVEWGVVAPLGYLNAIHVNNCDWIDTHCTWTFSPTYPALWLGRKDLSLRNMLRQK